MFNNFTNINKTNSYLCNLKSLYTKRPQNMQMENHVLAWDRHKNVTGLNQLMWHRVCYTSSNKKFHWKILGLINFFCKLCLHFSCNKIYKYLFQEHFWSLDETVQNLQPILMLQIWDNDIFNPDDFLGTYISIVQFIIIYRDY
jgi:hypothetical protein